MYMDQYNSSTAAFKALLSAKVACKCNVVYIRVQDNIGSEVKYVHVCLHCELFVYN